MKKSRFLWCSPQTVHGPPSNIFIFVLYVEHKTKIVMILFEYNMRFAYHVSNCAKLTNVFHKENGVVLFNVASCLKLS
jgi:hypothetical protein